MTALFNPLTHCYETKDKTSIPAELADSVASLADILIISIIRERQRIDKMQEKNLKNR